MSALALYGLLVLSGGAQAGLEGNRLWRVEVELSGPLEDVRFAAGAWGETRLVGSLLAAESRKLEVVLPWLAPLGASELADLPPPEAMLQGAGAATVVGWAGAQPHDAFARRHAALLARPRPPLAARTSQSGPGELLLLFSLGLVSLAVGRRPRLVGASCMVGAVLLTVLGARRSGSAERVELVEAEAERGLAVRITGGLGRLELGPRAVGLEVDPVRSSIVLLQDLQSGGVVAEAPGAGLFALAPSEAPSLTRDANGWRALRRAWVRTPGGDWSTHGAWSRGAPLPPAQGQGTSPPGWIAAGMPPGRAVLVAEDESGGWIRMLGFR